MGDLKPKQEQAAILLVSGMSGKETAESVGVTPETVSQWKKDPYFEAFTNQLRLETIESSREKLRFLSGKALKRLEHLIDNSESETIKLKASVEILKLSGLTDPETVLWGIGYTDVSKIIKQMKREAYEKLSDSSFI